eukprot:CAMPEP_0174893880 /NCGR_PEP_ID=MMETSP0167-20121228/8610_1 /TAXON_ID=38298 /ORGANISM="Rhodella maculata, Strain CCMP736" /LENGTH=208 /DNA_ID=CAMNT_0016132795 /DNA_START=30 /DNA_END=656 /DNA_ORIENTATION=-
MSYFLALRREVEGKEERRSKRMRRGTRHEGTGVPNGGCLDNARLDHPSERRTRKRIDTTHEAKLTDAAGGKSHTHLSPAKRTSSYQDIPIPPSEHPAPTAALLLAPTTRSRHSTPGPFPAAAAARVKTPSALGGAEDVRYIWGGVGRLCPLLSVRAAVGELAPAAGGLDQHGGAVIARDDGLGMREDGGDGVAADALDVQEPRVGALN